MCNLFLNENLGLRWTIAFFLTFTKAISQHNNVDVVRLIVFLSAALLYIAYLCHFGETVTSQFDKINYAIDQCSWYEFPMEMQRILPMMSMMAQSPVLVEAAYLNIGCSREVLKKVKQIQHNIGFFPVN